MVTRITMAFDLMNLLKKWCHILFVSKNDLLNYLMKTDIILLYLFCLHDRISKVVGAGNRFARSYFYVKPFISCQIHYNQIKCVGQTNDTDFASQRC
jgi:hypothetical protein